ncbi:MAG: hypothetical protein FWB79_03495 [Treponema sp.]|nr:hypothetical protein [Treponema sp.]
MQRDSEDNIFKDAVIEGLDIQKGLQGFPANVYTDVVRAWCKHFSANLETVRTLAGELSDAEKLREYTVSIHGFKGSNYGICADELGLDAEKLEAASRRGDLEYIGVNNGLFIEKATLLYARLQEFFAAHKEQPKENPKAGSPDAALLAQFLDACKQFRSTTMEDLLKQLESFEYESGGELVAWLRDQTDNLEYDAIQERLAREL